MGNSNNKRRTTQSQDNPRTNSALASYEIAEVSRFHQATWVQTSRVPHDVETSNRDVLKSHQPLHSTVDLIETFPPSLTKGDEPIPPVPSSADRFIILVKDTLYEVIIDEKHIRVEAYLGAKHIPPALPYSTPVSNSRARRRLSFPIREQFAIAKASPVSPTDLITPRRGSIGRRGSEESGDEKDSPQMVEESPANSSVLHSDKAQSEEEHPSGLKLIKRLAFKTTLINAFPLKSEHGDIAPELILIKQTDKRGEEQENLYLIDYQYWRMKMLLHNLKSVNVHAITRSAVFFNFRNDQNTVVEVLFNRAKPELISPPPIYFRFFVKCFLGDANGPHHLKSDASQLLICELVHQALHSIFKRDISQLISEYSDSSLVSLSLPQYLLAQQGKSFAILNPFNSSVVEACHPACFFPKNVPVQPPYTTISISKKYLCCIDPSSLLHSPNTELVDPKTIGDNPHEVLLKAYIYIWNLNKGMYTKLPLAIPEMKSQFSAVHMWFNTEETYFYYCSWHKDIEPHIVKVSLETLEVEYLPMTANWTCQVTPTEIVSEERLQKACTDVSTDEGDQRNLGLQQFLQLHLQDYSEERNYFGSLSDAANGNSFGSKHLVILDEGKIKISEKGLTSLSLAYADSRREILEQIILEDKDNDLDQVAQSNLIKQIKDKMKEVCWFVPGIQPSLADMMRRKRKM